MAHPLIWAAGAIGLLSLFILLLMSGFRAVRNDMELSTNAPKLSTKTTNLLFPPTVILVVLSFLTSIIAYSWYQVHPETSLHSLLAAFDQQRSDPECGHGAGANVQIPEQQGLVFEGFLQCRHEGAVSVRTVRRPLRYMFDLPPSLPSGSRISGLQGDFFIDQAGGARQQQARVTWDVIYQRDRLCTITAVGKIHLVAGSHVTRLCSWYRRTALS
jgi:hypothetical protein